MIIPRFSLRWLLLATTVLAVFFLIVSFALGGQTWAVGLVIGISSLVVVALLHGLVFLFAWLFAQQMALIYRPKPESPFAHNKLPPRVIQPRPDQIGQ